MKIQVDKNDLKEYLDQEEDCQIQIYADETYSVLPMGAYGYEGKIANFIVEYFDYVECGFDLDEFVGWLNDGFYHKGLNPINGEWIEIEVA